MKGQLTLFGAENTLKEKDRFEYFFLISPNQHIKEAIKELKIKLSKQIVLSPENLHSIAHISLFKCVISSKYDKIIPAIADAVLKGKSGFNIKLNGHFIFKHRNTESLVIKINEAEQIKEVSQLLAKGFKIKPFNTNPHITIARSITISDITKFFDNLSDYNYMDEFFCSEITILRKKAGSDEKYKLFHKVLLG